MYNRQQICVSQSNSSFRIIHFDTMLSFQHHVAKMPATCRETQVNVLNQTTSPVKSSQQTRDISHFSLSKRLAYHVFFVYLQKTFELWERRKLAVEDCERLI